MENCRWSLNSVFTSVQTQNTDAVNRKARPMTKNRNRMMQTVDLLRSNCISLPLEAKSLRQRHPLKDRKRNFESRRKCVTTGERRAEISRVVRSAVRRWPMTRAESLTREECASILPLQNRPEGGMKPKKNQSQAEEFHVSSAAPRGKRAEKCRCSV